MEVNELDFLPDLNQSRSTLPDQLPFPVQRDRMPSELLRSSTIESLISQNEDLMARLKVTLRRLSLLENENQKLNSEASSQKQNAAQAQDRLLVMKEKDNLWKAKIDELENAKQSIQEKYLSLHGLYQVAKNQAERLQKYHERIRTHVKPFIHELKKYSKTLELSQEELKSTLDKKEAQASALRQQIMELTKNSKFQIEDLEKKNWQVTEHFEMMNQQLVLESDEVKALNNSLSEKVERLQIFKERADQLENENIELRRRIETIQERHQNSLQEIQSQYQTQTSEVARLKVEHQDAKDRLMEEFEQRKTLEKQVFDLRHQLDSLRFMWTAKNDETEKLRLAQGALEKLNIDLSSKLQEMRKEEQLTPAQTAGIFDEVSTASGI